MTLTSCSNFELRAAHLAALEVPDPVERVTPARNTRPLTGICKLSCSLQTATKAVMAVLDDLTLADIAWNRGELLARIAPIEAGIVAPMRSSP